MTLVRVVVGNQKGGSGKTTTSANLASALVEQGYRVLAVDLDPQAQLASMLRAHIQYDDEGRAVTPNITHVLWTGDEAPLSLAQAIVPTDYEGLDVVPGSFSMRMTAMRMQNDGQVAAYYAIRELFKEQAMLAQGLEYDFVVFDTAPSLDAVLSAALNAADFVLPVLAPEALQVEALMRFTGWVEQIAATSNPGLRILPALVNKAVINWVASAKAVSELTVEEIDVFQTVIPTYAGIAATPNVGPVLFADPKSRAANVVRAAMLQVIDALAPVEVN